MAVLDYQGSLAQNGINFTTSITNTTVPGQNYYQIGLFVDSVIDAPTNLVAGYVVNTPIVFTVSNYTTLAILNSRLYTWLQNYFSVNASGQVFVVVYNGTTKDIVSAHTAMLQLAYFKMVFFGANGETAGYRTDVVNLAGLGVSSKGLTQVIVGTSDANILLASGVGSGTIDVLIRASGFDAMVSYSAVTAYNSMFSAIGEALSFPNPTGTPVGNNLDFNALSQVLPSTGVANTNLTATQIANLQSRNVGYVQTVGDGSGNVILNNRLSIQGKVITANWFVNYANYYCSLVASTIITTPGNYTFKNNSTYQQILGLIFSVISPFQSKLGRLSNFSITAPTFNQLPITGGSVLTIPNAWSAIYNDRVDTINVNGTLVVNL